MNDLSLPDITGSIEVMITVSRIGDAESAICEPVYNMRSTLITDVREAKRPPQQG
jgi:hypothetical protein